MASVGKVITSVTAVSSQRRSNTGDVMNTTAIVIGAGTAGLSAGCYLQMNGYRSEIFEMHSTPGGVCTTWSRNGYKIDGCIHWLTGSGPGSSFHRLWREVGVIGDRRFVDHDVYATIEGRNGRALTIYCDVDLLQNHMTEIAPEDGQLIAEFADGVRASGRLPMPVEKAPELFTLVDRLKMASAMAPFLRHWRRWRGVTITQFSRLFKNRFLREVFPYAVNLQHPPDFPILAFMTTLAWMSRRTAGYPIGGSLELARGLERRYLGLGGSVHYKSKVEKILVKDDRAVGVRLSDGSEHRSDIVISAADGHFTIFRMLDGKYASRRTRGYFDSLPLYRPLIYVGLGVARSFTDITPSVTGIDYGLDTPITIAGEQRNRLSLQIYNFDPTLAPDQKSVVRVWFNTSYDYWQRLSRDPVRYGEEKRSIAETVIAMLGARYRGLADDVEMWDVATPMTFERFTGNWRGSFEGWLISNRTLTMRMKKTLPGLDNFFMAGQWVEPGGSLPTSVMSGRNVVQLICGRDRKVFTTLAPRSEDE